jgi:hypothetical protein
MELSLQAHALNSHCPAVQNMLALQTSDEEISFTTHGFEESTLGSYSELHAGTDKFEGCQPATVLIRVKH